MLGAIVGDVIGSPYEQSNVKSTQFRLFDRGAQCTDDSILTVATADVLLHDSNYRDAYQNYFHRFSSAGYGGSFVVWANRRESSPYNSWGNGSAMRSSPVGWARDTLPDVLAEAERSAAVTHDHPDGIKGAQAIAEETAIRSRLSRERSHMPSTDPFPRSCWTPCSTSTSVRISRTSVWNSASALTSRCERSSPLAEPDADGRCELPPELVPCGAASRENFRQIKP